MVNNRGTRALKAKVVCDYMARTESELNLTADEVSLSRSDGLNLQMELVYLNFDSYFQVYNCGRDARYGSRLLYRRKK